MVTDDLVSGIWHLGRTLGQEDEAVAAATTLLPSPSPTPPFPGGADFRRLTGGDGRQYPTRTRMGCCLYYTICPAEAFLTCPGPATPNGSAGSGTEVQQPPRKSTMRRT